MNRRTEKRLRQLFHHGWTELKSANYSEAVRLLTKSAQGGLRHAMLALGSVYYWGKGITPNTEKGIYWLKRAADKGNRVACINLAHVYYNLGDTEKYNALAWSYYEKASAEDKDLFYLGQMDFEKRGKYDNDEQRLKDADAFFQVSLFEGCSLSGLYLWQMQREKCPDLADAYYADGEKLLHDSKGYNNWAWQLCEWGEYEMALPYIERCLSMELEGEENPNYLDTYAECLFGLGRKQDAERIFRMVVEAYRERDERRRLSETWEKMKSYGLEIE